MQDAEAPTEAPENASPDEAEAAPVEEVSGEVVAEIEEMRPSAEQLVVTDPGDREQVFRVLDAHDEDLILQELQGRLLRVMLYAFEQDGQQVVDLSYAGVNEAIREMNRTGGARITIDPSLLDVQEVTEDLGNGPEPCWMATVYAKDEVTGHGQFGTYIQPKRRKLKPETARRKRARGRFVADDDTIANPFARQTGLNKAQRNALRAMVPEKIRQTLIAQYRGDDVAVRRIKAGAGAEKQAELPPPLTDEKAEQQKAEARRLYEQVREHAPGGIAVDLTPAKFHHYLSTAEHSHDRLEDFLGFMREKAREAEDKANDAPQSAQGEQR